MNTHKNVYWILSSIRFFWKTFEQNNSLNFRLSHYIDYQISKAKQPLNTKGWYMRPNACTQAPHNSPCESGFTVLTHIHWTFGEIYLSDSRYRLGNETGTIVRSTRRTKTETNEREFDSCISSVGEDENL